jgi:hypothetical protein
VPGAPTTTVGEAVAVDVTGAGNAEAEEGVGMGADDGEAGSRGRRLRASEFNGVGVGLAEDDVGFAEGDAGGGEFLSSARRAPMFRPA